MGLVENVWNLLGKKMPILFGKECASAVIWMFSCLVLRFFLILCHLDTVVANGIVFAFPFFIQVLKLHIPCFEDCYPILPVRLAESILGRSSSSKLVVIIPAHFLGGVLGVVAFRALHLPFSEIAITPLQYDSSLWVSALFTEILAVGVYVLALLVLPVLLHLNRLPAWLSSIFIIPVMLLTVPNSTSSFSPTALYSLWFVNGINRGDFDILPVEHILGPILGGTVAGLVCVKCFPDDPKSWRRN